MSRRAALLVTALLAVSCRTAIPAVPLPPDDPRPAAFLAAHVGRGEERTSLRGHARLSVDGGNGAVQLRARQLLVVARPARLRVEVLGFLSQTALVLVTEGGLYQLLDARDGSFAEGPVTASLLWEIAYLALTPEEAADVVLGTPALDEGLVPSRAVQVGDDIQLDLVDGAGRVRQRIAFDESGRLQRIERLREDGVFLWQASYGAYRDVGGVEVAHAIDLEVAAGGTRAEIELADVELNPALSPDMFRLEPPAWASGEGR